MSGFSISNNLLANDVNLELSEHQQSLSTSVRDLSSGLRVNNAADDPSGNAIATTLQTHSQAFDTASQNVTNAQNAAAVADGALAAVTGILLRIRELAVGAASTIDSSSDRVDIQAEIGQLLAEINRIAQNTNFNGRALLDGSVAGFQPAQSATTIVEANSVLLTGSAGAGSFLLAGNGTGTYTTAIQPLIYFNVLQTVAASAVPQIVHVNNAAYIQPGAVYSIDGAIATVQSVDAANGTITAIFPHGAVTDAVASSLVISSLTATVSAGMNLATLTSPSPLYAGESLQLGILSTNTNDVVIVQQVLSSVSFIADFQKPHSGGTAVYNLNGAYLPASFGPGIFTFNFGSEATDSAPLGTAAYVVQSASGNFPPPDGTLVNVVATGTTIAGGVFSTSVQFTKQIPNIAGGGGVFQLIAPLGFGSTPVVDTVDGTIKLAVVNQSGTIGVQETFYDTASQTSVTASNLLKPGERSMLFDGVVTTLGDFSAADVGSTAYIKVLQSVAAVTASPSFTVQSGSDEGDVIQLGIPAVNTNTLRVSTVTVIGADGADPTLASEDAIGQVDYALQQVTTARAQVGAQIVKLSIDQTNDETAATELTASQSNITDLNVGAATEEFTEQQIDIDVTTSLLTQVNNLSEAILKLFPPP
ncbi:MAG: flagellin [Candidatus Aquilonibacter sp.]